MIENVLALIEEYQGLQQQLSSQHIATDPKALKKIGKRMAELEPVVPLAQEYQHLCAALKEAQSMQDDPELKVLAEEEMAHAQERLPVLEQQLKTHLVPKDPDDERSVILEVRAGTGGEEAALFASELLRMYLKYAEDQHWQAELYSKSEADAGGIKEAVVHIKGDGVYGKLRYESGVHRVQRVPSTESQGRLHTSAASVAIMPEAEEVDIHIKPEELKVDVFRSSGPGGQSVNTTDSAVRLTHIPTGTVVTCQDEKSQLKNKNKALNILRSRLYSEEQERRARERGELRAGQIGSGDRSEKIRTYNYPQDRVTDHRIKRNFSNLPSILEGNLDPILQTLKEERLAQLLEQ